MQSRIVVDGSVLCGDDARKTFDYDRLLAAVRDIRDSGGGDGSLTIKVFVDASLRWKLSTSDKKKLESDITSGLVEQTPAGLPADPFILRWAESHDAIVVTNDLFRDWVTEFPWISRPGSGRFVSGLYDTQLKKWTFLERHAAGSPRELSLLLKVEHRTTVAKSKPNLIERFLDPSSGKYKRAITRMNPTAVIFLLDQSASMNEVWTQQYKKSGAVASFVNDALYELVLACTRGGGVRPYVDIAVLGYGGHGSTGVRSLLSGTTTERPFLSISSLVELARTPQQTTHDASAPFATWIDPVADGATPMNQVMAIAEAAVSSWVKTHDSSFPPIIFNITDGDSTDGDPSESASKLTQHATADGNALLFTAHISANAKDSLHYPEFLDAKADALARTMFTISSHVPESLRLMARELGISIPPGARGFLYNASASEVVGMLNVGTAPTRADPNS